MGDDLGLFDPPRDGQSSTGGMTGSPPGSGGSNGAQGGSGGARAGEAGANGRGGRAAQGGSSGALGGMSSGGRSAAAGMGTTGGRAGTASGGRSAGGRTGMGGSGGRAGSPGAGGAGGGNAGTDGGVVSCSGSVPSNGSSHCSSNQSGNVGSQQWTVWSSGGGGCLITYGSDAAFSATWNNSGDFLARVGLALGSSKTYDQFGTLAADFAEKKSGSGGGYSSIGIYGWSVSPLVEFYVVEDSYNGLGASGTKKGSFTIDGEGTYNVYTHTQNNQPSIQGTATFEQFISVRQSARTCGHISLTKHFDAWKGFGMTLGKMEEAKVLIEAGGGSGRIDFTTASVTAQ